MLRFWRALAIALALLAAPLAGAQPALAHAELARSEPAGNSTLLSAPTIVKLWFTEDIESAFAEAAVMDKDGRRVDAMDGKLLGDDRSMLLVTVRDLTPGVYTVTWKAVSAVDGHVTRGSFAFGVRVAVNVAPPDPYPLQRPKTSAVAIRWLDLASVMVVAGGFAFLYLVWLPALAQVPSESTRTAIRRRALRRAAVLTAWALAALALAALGLLVVQAAALSDDNLVAALSPATLGGVLFGSRYGAVLLARLVLAAAATGVVVSLLRSAAVAKAPRHALRAGALLGLALLLTVSLTGHGGAIGRMPLANVMVDWVHLAAAATWVGGLVHLAAQLLTLRTLDRRDRTLVIAAAMPRFSTAAFSALVLLLATGLYGSVLQVPDLQALADTVYGNVLLAKLLLLVPLGVIGLVNLLVTARQFARAARSVHDQAAAPELRFRWLVVAEVGLGALLLLATGALTSTMSGRQAVALPGMRPLEVAAVADDLRVRLRVSPYEAGTNQFTAQLNDTAGTPVDVDRVTLRFRMREHDMGEREAVMSGDGRGLYSAQGSHLSMAGTWTTEVHIRRAGRDDAVAAFTLPVADQSPGKRAVAEVPDLADVANGPLVAAALVALGLAFALAAWRFGGAATRTGFVNLGLAVVWLVMAGFLGGSAQLGAAGNGAASADAAPRGAADRASDSAEVTLYKGDLGVMRLVVAGEPLSVEGSEVSAADDLVVGLALKPGDTARHRSLDVYLRRRGTQEGISNATASVFGYMLAMDDEFFEQSAWPTGNGHYLLSLPFVMWGQWALKLEIATPGQSLSLLLNLDLTA